MSLGRPLVGVGTPPAGSRSALMPRSDSVHPPQGHAPELHVGRGCVAASHVGAPGHWLDAAQLGSAGTGHHVAQPLDAGWSVTHGSSLPTRVG